MIRDVRAITRGARVILSWPTPTLNVEGKHLPSGAIAGYEILRAEIGSEGIQARYRPYAEVATSGTNSVEVRDGRSSWDDRDVHYGRIYGYRVRAESVRGGVSEPSPEVRVMPLMPPAIPVQIRAEAGDSSIVISWQSVTTRLNGSVYNGFVGYNIYRSEAGGRFDEKPLNAEPLRTPSFVDRTVVNGKTYAYRVRSVDSPALPWLESPDSAAASATPRDLTPPAPPTGLTVVAGIGKVFLSWSENHEPDLAGYTVYRSELRNGTPERLNKTLLTGTTYWDGTVTGGKTYYYTVTATDKTGNESRPAAARRARVHKPVGGGR